MSKTTTKAPTNTPQQMAQAADHSPFSDPPVASMAIEEHVNSMRGQMALVLAAMTSVMDKRELDGAADSDDLFSRPPFVLDWLDRGIHDALGQFHAHGNAIADLALNWTAEERFHGRSVPVTPACPNRSKESGS